MLSILNFVKLIDADFQRQAEMVNLMENNDITLF